MPSLEQLSSGKYVLLTTFRRDGRAVPTALWVVPDASGLAVWTVKDSGKVKRIRNNGRVTLAACDVRGKQQGEAVEAHARLGEPADRDRVISALRRKYGLIGWLTLFGSRLRRGADGTVAVLVS
jgi:PPOX class probable F420-dependent enzyme